MMPNHLIPERDRQTDGQNCYINIARQCADAIKITFLFSCKIRYSSLSFHKFNKI